MNCECQAKVAVAVAGAKWVKLSNTVMISGFVLFPFAFRHFRSSVLQFHIFFYLFKEGHWR